jgi:hypothetical protein
MARLARSEGMPNIQNTNKIIQNLIFLVVTIVIVKGKGDETRRIRNRRVEEF